jgi:DNA-directed RNA polymerase sigma subunit (sigma70/sigma32)
MTRRAAPDGIPDKLFVAEFYPELGEYLAERLGKGYDPSAGRARFLAWLGADATPGPVNEYLTRVSDIPMLSATEEAELAARIAAGRLAENKLAETGLPLAGDQRANLELIAEDGRLAELRLIEANLSLVVTIASRYTGRGVAFADLIQEGNLGLIKAAAKLDHAKGYRFTTYATWWIRQAITRAVVYRTGASRIGWPSVRPSEPELPDNESSRPGRD